MLLLKLAVVVSLRMYRICRRALQARKPKQNVQNTPQFSESFYQLGEQIETKLPFHVNRGEKHDKMFAEIGEDEKKRLLDEEEQGQKFEDPIKQRVVSYFSGQDISGQALGAKAQGTRQYPHHKLPQDYLKTSSVTGEFNYNGESPSEAFRRRVALAGGGAITLGLGVYGFRSMFAVEE